MQEQVQEQEPNNPVQTIQEPIVPKPSVPTGVHLNPVTDLEPLSEDLKETVIQQTQETVTAPQEPAVPFNPFAIPVAKPDTHPILDTEIDNTDDSGQVKNFAI